MDEAQADAGGWLAYELIGNSLLAWAAALAVLAGVWLALSLTHRVIRSRVAMLAASRADGTPLSETGANDA